MPANNDYPIVDGVAPSWADVIVQVSPTSGALIDVKDIKSISTGVTVEVGEARAGGRVMKRTTGSLSCEASMTLYREGYNKLLRGLKDAAPTRGSVKLISLVTFGVQIKHTPPNTDEIHQTRIKGCRLLARTLASAEGTDADTVDVTLNPLEIVDVIDGEEVSLL